jgi:hypothetical protein
MVGFAVRYDGDSVAAKNESTPAVTAGKALFEAKALLARRGALRRIKVLVLVANMVFDLGLLGRY